MKEIQENQMNDALLSEALTLKINKQLKEVYPTAEDVVEELNKNGGKSIWHR